MIPYSRATPYPRVNCLKTIPFTEAHTHIAHIWQYPPPPPGGRTQTSQWLFTSMREELNIELSETNSSNAQSQWDLSIVITKVLVLYKFWKISHVPDVRLSWLSEPSQWLPYQSFQNPANEVENSSAWETQRNTNFTSDTQVYVLVQFCP